MISETFDKLTDEIADQVIQKLGPKLIEFLDQRRITPEKDDIMSVQQAADYLGFSDTTIYQLIDGGYLKTVPGIVAKRIRRSVLDAYGKDNPSPKRK